MKSKDYLALRNREIYDTYSRMSGNGKTDEEIFYQMEGITFNMKKQPQRLNASTIRHIVYKIRKAEKVRNSQNVLQDAI